MQFHISKYALIATMAICISNTFLLNSVASELSSTTFYQTQTYTSSAKKKSYTITQMQPTTLHHRSPNQYTNGFPDRMSPVIAKQYGLSSNMSYQTSGMTTPANAHARAATPGASLQLQPKYTSREPSVVHKWVYLVCALITLILTIVICATPVYTLTFEANGETTADVRETAWTHKECKYTTDSNGNRSPNCKSVGLPDDTVSSCRNVKDRQRTIQAMIVLAIIFAVVALVVSVLERLDKIALKYDSLILLTAFIPVFLFNFFTWAIMAGTFHADSCDGDNMKEWKFRMSASFALSLCLWLIHMIFLVFFVFVARRGREL